MQAPDNTGYLLQHLASTMARQNDLMLQERLGIGFSQFKLMMVLEKNPHIQQRDIAESLGQTEASISRQVKLMHEQGLIQTSVSPANRRRHITKLTPKGVRSTEQAMKLLNDYHAPVFEHLSQHEQGQFLDLLYKMHEGVCQPGRTGACHQATDV